MNSASRILNQLATKHVGDGKTLLVFVTDDDATLAVFNHQFKDDAIDLAKSFDTPCWVEDKTGVIYDNPASVRRQRSEED